MAETLERRTLLDLVKTAKTAKVKRILIIKFESKLIN